MRLGSVDKRTAAVSPSTLSLRLIRPGVEVDEDEDDDSGGYGIFVILSPSVESSVVVPG